MKTIRRFLVLTAAAILMLVVDMTQPQQPQQSQRPQWLPSDVQVISDAHAVLGRQRRTRRRGAAVGYQAGKTAGAAEANQQQEQAEGGDQQQAAGDQQQAATAQQAPADTPPPAEGALPLGKVVDALPEGCITKEVDGVEYYHDGVNYYRAVFQGNQLVYVTAQP